MGGIQSQISRYAGMVGKANIGSKSRASAMLRTSGGGSQQAAVRQQLRSQPNMAGYNKGSGTLLNVNGSGYDNPANHNGLMRSRAAKYNQLPGAPLSAAGTKTKATMISDYRKKH